MQTMLAAVDFGRFLEFHNLYGTSECECCVIPPVPDDELFDINSRGEWTEFWVKERNRVKLAEKHTIADQHRPRKISKSSSKMVWKCG